jgi:hypothetical protein
MEFHALQSFSLARSRDASRRPAALLPCTASAVLGPATAGGPSTRGPAAARRARRLAKTPCDPFAAPLPALAARLGSRALLPEASPLRRRRRSGRRRARCSPGLRAPLQGAPSPPVWRDRERKRRLLPRAWRRRRLRHRGACATVIACPSECVRAKTGRRPKTPADPHEVCLPHRRPRRLGSGPALAHGFTSGPRHVTVAAGPLFGQSPCRPANGAAPCRSSSRSSCR